VRQPNDGMVDIVARWVLSSKAAAHSCSGQ